jgi:hypothetical protein
VAARCLGQREAVCRGGRLGSRGVPGGRGGPEDRDQVQHALLTDGTAFVSMRVTRSRRSRPDAEQNDDASRSLHECPLRTYTIGAIRPCPALKSHVLASSGSSGSLSHAATSPEKSTSSHEGGFCRSVSAAPHP